METALIYVIAAAVFVIIFVPYFIKFRKAQLESIKRREEAEKLGLTRGRTQYPFIDEEHCIGCGSCVAACPESDVLAVVNGKAMIVNGLRCIGHGHCEKVCPVNALKVGLGDLARRDDIPLLNDSLETTVPGLYIVGELSGFSLIRNAISQGQRAVNHIASQNGKFKPDDPIKEVIIVGAGPAGLTAALACKKHNLDFLVLDRQGTGGTILQYPRRKLVMTQPVELPLYGRLKKHEYTKEELLDIWEKITADYQIEVKSGYNVEHISKEGDVFTVHASGEIFQARKVVLALGRRGVPRKLHVPGEEMSKVMYNLIDAQSYKNCHILVVGGGDSAVEAAVGLARQKGNRVTISYRKSQFFRIKKKNEERINRLIKEKKIQPIFNSTVLEIRPDAVKLRTEEAIREIPNDFTFIFAGGEPPFKMLRKMGIQFGGQAPPRN